MDKYTATIDFVLPLSTGEKTVATSIRTGDVILFDGSNVEHNGMKGSAPLLSKMVGDWLVLAGKATRETKQKASEKAKAPMASRNRTAGRILEDSEAGNDPNKPREQRSQDEYEELKGLVAKADNYKPESEVTDDHADMRMESANSRPKPRIIDEDANEVRKVSEPANQGTNKNEASVAVSPEDKRLPVVSDEERVAKATDYSKKGAATQSPKKIMVDSEATPQVVRKTGSPAGTKLAKEPTGKLPVSKEEDAVKVTNYEKTGATQVGSSTQTKGAKVVRPAVEQQDADAVVVKRVSKTELADLEGGRVSSFKGDTAVTVDGIISRVTVGPSGEASEGVATYGSGEANDGAVTFGSGLGDDSELSADDILNGV